MKILITGPESSGKTHLADALCDKLDLPLVKEYARLYLENNSTNYDYTDLLKIAKGHIEEVKGLNCESYILDTFLINIKTWSIQKFGKYESWMDREIVNRPFDIIFLLKPNIKWEYDPLRESPNDRDFLFDEFKKELDSLDWKYHIIDAIVGDRVQQALSIYKKQKTS